MYCICCKKNNVTPYNLGLSDKDAFNLKEPTEEEILWKERKTDRMTLTINNEMVSDGIIQIVNAGYGSLHDGDQIILAICDGCIKSNLEDATLLYWGNYLGPMNIQDDVDDSKRKYRRRKNLDNLT